MSFWREVFTAFWVALGVVVGGSFMGGVASASLGQMPARTMSQLAEKLKIWGMVASMGGTFDTIKNIEAGLLGGSPEAVLRQAVYLIGAFMGAHLGYVMVTALVTRQ